MVSGAPEAVPGPRVRRRRRGARGACGPFPRRAGPAHSGPATSSSAWPGSWPSSSCSVPLLDWVIQVRGLGEFLTGQGTKLYMLATYLLNYSPAILMMPTSGDPHDGHETFAFWSATNELTAMKASGILYRISLPALGAGAGGELFSGPLGKAWYP